MRSGHTHKYTHTYTHTHTYIYIYMYIRVCTCRYISTTYGRPPQKVLLDVVHDLQLLECPALMDALNQAAGYDNGQVGWNKLSEYCSPSQMGGLRRLMRTVRNVVGCEQLLETRRPFWRALSEKRVGFLPDHQPCTYL